MIYGYMRFSRDEFIVACPIVKTGHHFSKEQKELMVYHCIIKESTAQFAFENIFVHGDVELNTVKQLWEKRKKEYETAAHSRNSKIVSL